LIEVFLKNFFAFFWSLVFLKELLFWSFLWQLKEYHWGRFLAHFDTFKGKRIFLNPYFFLKIFFLILFSFFWLPIFSYLLVLIFAGEAAFFLFKLKKRKLFLPKTTLKSLAIILNGFILTGFLVFFFLKNFSGKTFYLSLLFLDILAPLIFSALVLVFEPLAIAWRLYLMKKAREKRKKFKDLKVVAIVGSYGKTSTKEFLSYLLSKKYQTLKTKEHQNSEVGISRCLLDDLKESDEYFVCEMGAYNRGGIKMLCDIVLPQFGIVTGINEQHLATFGTMENLLSAEGGLELIQSLPSSGFIILNGDNEIIKNSLPLYQRLSPQLKKLFYSTKEKRDLFAENIKVAKDSLSFEASNSKGERALFNLKIVGGHNVENILAAVLAANEFGISLKEAAAFLQDFEGKGAILLKKGKEGVALLDSSYSANPTGVISALNHLKLWQGKKILIMPCLIELGKMAKEIHFKIGREIAKSCDLAIILARDYFEEIKKGALKEGLKEEQIVFLERPELIFEKIKPFLKPGNVILLEGRVPKTLISLLEKED
jgi:UDP-N-acetylmuramoyl-tripeptide--D-alanyl-D-alanine ligase